MKERNSFGKIILIAAVILVLLFLYFPVVIVALYSFNKDSINSFPMGGFTFHWYAVMVHNQPLTTSLVNSVEVAFIGTCIAILIGVPGALGMHKYNFPGKKALEKVVILPMMLPGIITGIAILTFLEMAGIMQGRLAVILGHSTFLIGTVLPQVYTRLRQLDRNIEEASQDLGASGFQTFFYVILPNIKTAVFGAALLSFSLSLDEIPVTYFLNGVFTTLPIRILAMTRNGFTPEINAICTLILLLSVFAVIFSNSISKKDEVYAKNTH
ncbi:MAG: ABC transporter permease [Treponema sp.]|nr:ABC transporter permease [Treponema sp.]